MEHLYATIRQRHLDTFPGADVRKTKCHYGFRCPSGKYFCILEAYTSKIWLHYAGIHGNIASEPLGFVVHAHRHSRWRSAIRDETDFSRALGILKGLHAGIGRMEPA